MLGLIYFITVNNLRSYFGRKDLLFYFIGLLSLLFLLFKGLYPQIEKYPVWFLAFVIEIFRIHQRRKDFFIIRRLYFSILFCEYIIYSIPILILYAISDQWEYILILLFFILTIILLPRYRGNVVKYPFFVFSPFWTIFFRKNKLFLLYPISVFLIIKGFTINNIGLVYFSLALFFFGVYNILTQRELKYHICISVYKGEKYLLKQLKNTLANSIIVFSPLIMLIMFYDIVQIWIFFPILFLLLEVNLIKYAFFENDIHQVLVFIFCLVLFPFLLPLVAFPYLYYLSVKNIKLFQDVKTGY